MVPALKGGKVWQVANVTPMPITVEISQSLQRGARGPHAGQGHRATHVLSCSSESCQKGVQITDAPLLDHHFITIELAIGYCVLGAPPPPANYPSSRAPHSHPDG